LSFFNLLSDEPIVRGDEKIPTHSTSQRVLSCEDCKLYEGARSPKLRFTGEGDMGILIVGEQPSREEDRIGEYGSGTEYQFLKDHLKEIGIRMNQDCYYTTAINCAPTKTRQPLAKEVSCCSVRLKRLVEKLQPKVIILVGDHAAESLIRPRLSGRINGLQIDAFMNKSIPDQEYGAYLCPIWGIKDLMAKKKYDDGAESKPMYEKDKAYYTMWKTSLAKACGLHSPIMADYRSECIIIEDEDGAVEALEKALTWEKVAFDYETTGIKPHREGHHIRTIGISDGAFAIAFPVFDSKRFRRAWRNLMRSDVKKIVQNLPYEMIWTYIQCGYWVENWYWDTMIAQHCLDNKNPTSLKYMVYNEFGHAGYDDEVDQYLKPVKAEEEKYGGNAINRIDQAPLDKLLLYNALDALYTYKIAELQKGRFSEDQLRGFKFFMESEQVLTKVTENGFNIDMDKHRKVSDKLDDLMAEQVKKIQSNEVLKQWPEKEFNFQSATQLGKLLFEILKITPTGYTASGQPSVDEENLAKLDLPLITDILAYRKLMKLKKTYITQYAVEANEGIVRPSFGLARVDTFRSSSSGPNIQNQPKRDKEAKKLIRSFIRPSKGNRLVEMDYRALEVCINAVYSNDPTLVKYITDPSSDMHRDSAADCFLLKPEEVTKPIRNDVKGQFVFAEFYGSYYKQVAIDLWETAHRHSLIPHLKDKGIATFRDFEKHIEHAEKILWEERFPVHNEWREKQWKFYQKHGYVELLTGFRCYGPMGRNNTFNSPVQGAGYHVLQWTLNQVHKKMEKLERSRIIGEIHDSCVMDVHPSEQELVDHWYWLYGTQKVREHWDWITVPLTVEKEHSEIDGSWAEMSDAGTLKGD
jgi:uracil-DNA glycosylase family 4